MAPELAPVPSLKKCRIGVGRLFGWILVGDFSFGETKLSLLFHAVYPRILLGNIFDSIQMEPVFLFWSLAFSMLDEGERKGPHLFGTFGQTLLCMLMPLVPIPKGRVLPAWPWSYTPAESLCVEIYRSERSNTHVESPSVHTVPRWGMCDLPLTTWSGRWALWLREQSIAAGISWKSLGKFWIFYCSLSSGVHTPLLVKAASFEPTDERSQLASWTPSVSS